MANLSANICHFGATSDIRECFNMITSRSARLMNRKDHSLEVGKSADFVVLDCETSQAAVRELSPGLYAYKRGRTVIRATAELQLPG